MRRAVAAIIIVLLAVVAIALFSGRKEQAGPVVLAAASLQESLEAVAQAWEADGNPRPILSFAGTPALARQIQAGAPADLFISADQEWMDEIARKGLIRARSRATLLGNRLVLVEPAANNTELSLEPGEALARALGTGRLAMADPDTVPGGRYARQALTSLDIWEGLADRVIRTENVRVALSLVSQGEAPLGIVYQTDAMADPGVRIIASFPDSSHVPITYPLALLKTSANKDAEALRRFLLTPEAADIFRRFGFEPASAP